MSLKKISSYPENALAWAMEKLHPEERSEFEKTCTKLENMLGNKPKKTGTTRQLPSNAELFENHIIPKIIEGIRNVEAAGKQERVIEVKVDLNLRTDFVSMSLEELASVHVKIVELERSIQAIENFYKFYRGLVYLTVHQKCDSKEFLKWITMQQVSKTTVYRYIAFSSLIMRFPGLILCDLNFSQLLKHKERILDFMSKETNSKLAHQLGDTVEFRIGTVHIQINASDCNIPHIKGISFPPDWKILDTYQDTDLSEIPPVSTQGATEIVDETVEDLEEQILKLKNLSSK